MHPPFPFIRHGWVDGLIGIVTVFPLVPHLPPFLSTGFFDVEGSAVWGGCCGCVGCWAGMFNSYPLTFTFISISNTYIWMVLINECVAGTVAATRI